MWQANITGSFQIDGNVCVVKIGKGCSKQNRFLKITNVLHIYKDESGDLGDARFMCSVYFARIYQ